MNPFIKCTLTCASYTGLHPTADKNKIRVRIWGNPGNTSKVNRCFFFLNLQSEKRMNLSRLASLNINRRKNSSDKKYNWSLVRLVPFLHFCCCLCRLYTIFLNESEKYKTIQNYSTPISVKNILHPFDWLELICIWKLRHIAFQCV